MDRSQTPDLTITPVKKKGGVWMLEGPPLRGRIYGSNPAPVIQIKALAKRGGIYEPTTSGLTGPSEIGWSRRCVDHTYQKKKLRRARR